MRFNRTDPTTGHRDPGALPSDSVRQDVISTAVTTGLRPDRLYLDASFKEVFSQLNEYLKRELMACMSSVRFFSYAQQSALDMKEWQSNENLANAVGQILGALNGQGLGVLLLSDVRPKPARWRGQFIPTPTSFLRESNFTHLRRLQLVRFICREDDLMAALLQCSSSLVGLELEKVQVITSTDPWLDILRLLPSMPELHHVSLKYLRHGPYRRALNVSFASLRSSGSHDSKYVFDTEQEEEEVVVAEVFRKLTSSPLSYMV